MLFFNCGMLCLFWVVFFFSFLSSFKVHKFRKINSHQSTFYKDGLEFKKKKKGELEGSMLSSGQAKTILSIPRKKFLDFQNVTIHVKQDIHFLWGIFLAHSKAEVHFQVSKISCCLVSMSSGAR